jgi:diguanylate cyclase (GGDEF)-like protein/PAS domain S-box-containing protein
MKSRMNHYSSVQAEHEQHYPDGREIHISERQTPDGGRVCIFQDVTEDRKARADQRIAATAFESQEGMSVTDANGIYLRINKAFTNITGYNTAEVIGKTPQILKSGRHDASFYAAMWESINHTGTWEGEIWNRRKNGEVYPDHLTITAVKNAEGVVTNYVSTLTDITLTKAAEDEIKHLAFYDPLTRLPNRRLLLDRLKQALASIVRSGCTGALLFIDLDNFKTLNDTLGHDTGDILLQQVANRLESCVREGDTVARLGGDEFVIMLENLSEDIIQAAEQTELVGNKILSSLNQPYQLDSHEYHNTPSIGVTLFSDTTQSIDELMKQADIAMYQSKKAGRNTLHFFDPKMQETIDTRAAIERELRDALEKQQFQLYFQLQVNGIGEDGAHLPIGAEILVRWIHPERGLISPAEFIPMAEESGLILPLGQWVLDTACAQIKKWEKAAATQNLVLAVNVSAKQFRQMDFVSQVKDTVQRHGINPTLLKLELTESLLLEDIESTISRMNELNKMGFLFSLDDFGTGYSSLQYLKRLPLDQIKIDQSFVRDIVFDVNDRAIVKTIIAMAISLNLKYIAEGVETEGQRKLLFEMGCNHYQGYLYCKPMPIEQFEALLQPAVFCG